jgi:glycolate oxidase FAD binding subunit
MDDVLLAFAAEIGNDDPVAAEGSRTRWSFGGPLLPGTRLLRAPAGIVEQHPEEMTVRVRAGTAVAALHTALAETGQRTALPERGGTVGGALAVGENHVDVLGRGTLRSSALQVRYVSAKGRVVTGGGATVKNVSGFDLPRLLVGSLGTLGLIAEAVLRTNPIPPATVWITAREVDPFDVFRALLRPAAVLWDGTRTWVHLEGHDGDVVAQRADLRALGAWDDVAGPPPMPPSRASLKPSELRALDPAVIGPFVASIGVGTVLTSDPLPARPASPTLRALSRRVKTTFDPTGRLNPERDPATRP